MNHEARPSKQNLHQETQIYVRIRTGCCPACPLGTNGMAAPRKPQQLSCNVHEEWGLAVSSFLSNLLVYVPDLYLMLVSR